MSRFAGNKYFVELDFGAERVHRSCYLGCLPLLCLADPLLPTFSQLTDLRSRSYQNEPLETSENELSCLGSCLRGCSIVPIFSRMPPGQQFAKRLSRSPRFRAALTRAPLESSKLRSIAMVTEAAPTSAVYETTESAQDIAANKSGGTATSAI